MKDVHSQEGGGFFRCGRPHFFCAKTSDSLKIMVRLHGQRLVEGLSQCKHFADKRVNFSQFCEAVFYGRPLRGYTT